MAETIGKIRVANSRLFFFWCPACDHAHWFRVGAVQRPNWTWNEDYENPTVRPSIDVAARDPKWRCHFHLTEGKIQYQKDCHHELRGQTVDMVEWPIDEEHYAEQLDV